MIDRDVMANWLDGEQARRLVEGLGAEGCLVERDRPDGEGWAARLSCPWLAGEVVGRGRSRVLAISAAHLASIRVLERMDFKSVDTLV